MLRDTQRTFFLMLGLFLIAPIFSHASTLLNISDKISTSIPGEDSSHVVEFRTTNPIEAGGEIHIRFDGKEAPFIFDDKFDFTNVDLFVDDGIGNFKEYPMDSFSDAATSTSHLEKNGDGEIIINLAYESINRIPEKTKVKVMIGAGQNSSKSIQNPISISSHLVTISTYTPDGQLIDIGKTFDVTIPSTSITTLVKGYAAKIFNGLPKGLLPGETKKVMVSVETNNPAYCKYSYEPNKDYEEISNVQKMKYANMYRLHSYLLDVKEGQKYKIYIRCLSKYGLEMNGDDYVIEFEVGVTNKDKTPPAPPPGTQSGSNSGGGNMLEQSDFKVLGKTFPGAQVVILKDGKEFKTLVADSQGAYSASTDKIDRGTYTFGITSVLEGVRSAPFTTTVYVNGATKNTIGPVYISPVITSKTDRINTASSVLVFGKAVPLFVVQAIVVKQKDALQQPYIVASTTANGSGDWSLNLNTTNLSKGTYIVKAQTIVPGQGNSQFSPDFLLGVGEKPQGDGKKKADINGDGKVNLADLSIMLFNWRKSAPAADLNNDGAVNITDFSILLSAWTA